ncbi:ovarian-specific serine/threonine-protein kinase Lok-like [Pieris brassicae]|uniref:Uncharacterized protein n=1 Tax=Pieris brassicae TaxID=7116 RepID=A0A9P0TDU6_PIEBR|nr:ovarian-specific serine/threonine-protein kinase Lok-like [Pieris brassicae]CAH4028528.1 unnamed protein product [Pieris brassicae]
MEPEINDNTQTQTQTQNSQVEWTQSNTPTPIPNIWGRLYLLNSWRKECILNLDQYYDLTEPEFSVGRALDSTFPIKKDTARIDIIKNVSKRHFIILRDRSETSSPAVLTDTSYNGTYINGVLIGKGKSRVLDDNDVIAITHPTISMFTFKDLLKNEQDKVPKEISQKYYISRVLGQGACGVVKLVYNKLTCMKFAMKVVKKGKLTNGQINNLTDPVKVMNEVNILKALRHPCVTSVEEIFDSREAVYIVLELMQGGELFDRITRYGRLSERLTKFYFKQMVLAVQYLHSQGITHRDLKPENVLLESKEDESLVKITDFGLSKYVGEDSFMKTMCGTPIYLAPEVLRANGVGCYGPEVDVWCLGVIFFICLVGYLPFSPEYQELPLSEQILSGRYRYSSSCWRDVSLQAKLLMKRMLTVNVRRRISLEQILKHPWMQDDDINLRIDVLLSQHQLKNENEENNNKKADIAVVRLVAANKRPISDSSNTAEPIAKKVKVGRRDENDDTSSATSCYSEE